MPFLDLAAATAEVRTELDEAIGRVLASGRFLLAGELEAFEAEFAAYVGVQHCVGVGSGLDALTLALRAAEIGPGDEVIVPGHTFVATWLAVSATGATPVPVDVDPQTFCMDPGRVDDAIGPWTRAVIPVHLYGHPAEMDEIAGIAQRHGLFLLEDAAQAHGARYRGRPVGSLGNAAAWSFYPAKNLGALADGGAVTTDDSGLAERVRLLRNYGSRSKYVHEMRGTNSRLDEVNAATLRVKLPRLDAWNARRRAVAQRYCAALQSSSLHLPSVAPGAEAVWHVFAVRHPRRDALRAWLQMTGIGTLIHYPVPPHLQAAYADLGIAEGSLPVAESLSREVVSLPMGPHLTADQVERVIRVLLEWGGR